MLWNGKARCTSWIVTRPNPGNPDGASPPGRAAAFRGRLRATAGTGRMLPIAAASEASDPGSEEPGLGAVPGHEDLTIRGHGDLMRAQGDAPPTRGAW